MLAVHLFGGSAMLQRIESIPGVYTQSRGQTFARRQPWEGHAFATLLAQAEAVEDVVEIRRRKVNARTDGK